MVKITGVEAITVSSQLLPTVSPDLPSAHRLTVAVDYRDTYRITVFMDVLYDLVREALDGLLPAAPTLTGWQHLTTSLYGLTVTHKFYLRGSWGMMGPSNPDSHPKSNPFTHKGNGYELHPR